MFFKYLHTHTQTHTIARNALKNTKIQHENVDKKYKKYYGNRAGWSALLADRIIYITTFQKKLQFKQEKEDNNIESSTHPMICGRFRIVQSPYYC